MKRDRTQCCVFHKLSIYLIECTDKTPKSPISGREDQHRSANERPCQPKPGLRAQTGPASLRACGPASLRDWSHPAPPTFRA